MSPTLLLSPTLHAALEHGVGQVRALRQSNAFTPVYVLLPREEAIRQWEQRLGAAMGVHLLQFHALAQAILRQGHRSVQRAHTDEQLQIVTEILTDLAGRGVLTTFVAVANRPGLARALLDWLREMEAQGITPRQLQRQADLSGSARDCQLAAVYRCYERALASRHKADGDRLIGRAAHALAQDGSLFAATGLLLVAGFDQFSPVQLRLLGQLSRRVPGTVVYLLWDSAQDAAGLALSRLRQTRADLEEALQPSTAVLAADAAVPDSLAHLRHVLFRAGITPAGDPGQRLRAVEAPSREAEVRWALREAKRLLLAGVRPDGIALLAPRPDAYERAVAAVAQEYGVPVRLERPLLECPAVAAFAGLLSLAPEFPRRETFDALRSPYTSIASGAAGEQPWLTAEQVATLDRLTRERPVVAGREQWQQALRRPAADAAGDGADDERADASLLGQLPADQVAAIEAGLLTFFAHLTPPDAGTRIEFTLWLQERILGLFADGDDEPAAAEAQPSLHLARCCEVGAESRRDIDAVARLTLVLRRLALRQKTAPEAISWEQYRGELLARLAAVSAPSAGGAQAVHFDGLQLGRHLAVDHLFVLGLSEGEFPSLPAADVFYAEEERRHHPLPLVRRDAAEDACLWWQVLACARSRVTLLRPRFDDSGAPWPPSPYWDAALLAAGVPADGAIQVPIASVPAP
ncbi:MAG: PD-(D/E)XK nuclease family protein, partial [Anaerolineae bacterium]